MIQTKTQSEVECVLLILGPVVDGSATSCSKRLEQLFKFLRRVKVKAKGRKRGSSNSPTNVREREIVCGLNHTPAAQLGAHTPDTIAAAVCCFKHNGNFSRIESEGLRV